MGWSLKVVSVLALILLWIFFVVQPWGFVATRMACTDTGGVTTERTVDANSYFNATSKIGCYECLDEVATGAYDFVDIYYERPASAPADWLTTGYKRYEILTAPDARCDWWYQGSRSKRAKSQYGLEEKQCIGFYSIQEDEVSRFESRQVLWKSVSGPLGIDLYMHEIKIVDRETGDHIAQARDFRFVNSLSEAMSQKSAMYSCPNVDYTIFGAYGLRANVLNDSSGEHHVTPAAHYIAPGSESESAIITPAFSNDATIHVIGAYRAAPPPDYRPTHSGRPDSGDIHVKINGSGNVILVLTAHDPVRWVVQPNAATITQIVTFGYHEQEVFGAPQSTAVYSSPTLSHGNSKLYAYKQDANLVNLENAIYELTGKELQSFQGNYNGEKFIVQVN